MEHAGAAQDPHTKWETAWESWILKLKLDRYGIAALMSDARDRREAGAAKEAGGRRTLRALEILDTSDLVPADNREAFRQFLAWWCQTEAVPVLLDLESRTRTFKVELQDPVEVQAWMQDLLPQFTSMREWWRTRWWLAADAEPDFAPAASYLHGIVQRLGLEPCDFFRLPSGPMPLRPLEQWVEREALPRVRRLVTGEPLAPAPHFETIASLLARLEAPPVPAPPAPPPEAALAPRGTVDPTDSASAPRPEQEDATAHPATALSPPRRSWVAHRTNDMPLRGWHDICLAVGFTREEAAKRVRFLRRHNRETGGPILSVRGKPQVDRGELLAWFTDTRAQYEAILEQAAATDDGDQEPGERGGAHAADLKMRVVKSPRGGPTRLAKPPRKPADTSDD